MINWYSLMLLAQEAADKAAPAAKQPAQVPQFTGILIYAIPIMVVWYLLFLRPQTKERSQRQELLKSLKKNDNVVTIGGILGTVSHLSDDGKEVTLRLEDNARMKIRRDAISEVRNDKSNPG